MKTDTKEKILTFIQKNGDVRVHELAEKFSLSKVALHKQLKKLLGEGKVIKEGKPPVVYYHTAGQDDDFQKIKKKVLPVLKKAKVKKAAIFGSFARGDYDHDSDIDFLVDMPDGANLIDLVGIKQDLEETLGKEVDVVTYASIHPVFETAIARDQKVII